MGLYVINKREAWNHLNGLTRFSFLFSDNNLRAFNSSDIRSNHYPSLNFNTIKHTYTSVNKQIEGEGTSPPPKAVSTIMMTPTERNPNGKVWSVWSCGQLN